MSVGKEDGRKQLNYLSKQVSLYTNLWTEADTDKWGNFGVSIFFHRLNATFKCLLNLLGKF